MGPRPRLMEVLDVAWCHIMAVPSELQHLRDVVNDVPSGGSPCYCVYMYMYM